MYSISGGSLSGADVTDLRRLEEEEARRWQEWGRLRDELDQELGQEQPAP